MYKLKNLFNDSFLDYCKNPIVVFPTLILWIFFAVFSKISVMMNYKLQDSYLLTSWLVLFSIISLLVTSFFLSGLIGICGELIKKKFKKKSFFYNSRKFWLRNFLVIIIFVILYNVVRYIAHNAAFFIGKSLSLEVNAAVGMFFLFYFTGILGILIFFSFTSFYLINYNLSVLDSIKKSFFLVKKRYIETLIIFIIFFVINEVIVKFIPSLGVELINALFVVPYLSLILSRFVLTFGEK